MRLILVLYSIKFFYNTKFLILSPLLSTKFINMLANSNSSFPESGILNLFERKKQTWISHLNKYLGSLENFTYIDNSTFFLFIWFTFISMLSEIQYRTTCTISFCLSLYNLSTVCSSNEGFNFGLYIKIFQINILSIYMYMLKYKISHHDVYFLRTSQINPYPPTSYS